MGGRIPVFIYATDPISAAGARSQLSGQPVIELVGPADVDRARVAVVVADAADEGAVRVVKAIQRDSVPRVVLVAARFDEAGVLSAVAAGVTAFLRRADAATPRLIEVIRQADEDGCLLPEGLRRKAAAAAAPNEAGPPSTSPLPLSPPSPLDLVDDALGESTGTAGSTITVALSQREAEVMRLVADGLDTSDIAESLSYSESTIKGVLAKLMSRLEARNRCHAVAILVREGLI